VIGLSVRGRMLADAMAKVERILPERYGIDFKVKNYRFTGLTTVTFDHIEVLPKEREKLADIEKMSVSVRLWALLFGDVKIGNLGLKNAKVSLVKQDSISNYDFLFRKKEQDTIKQEKEDRKSTRLNSSHVKNSYAVF